MADFNNKSLKYEAPLNSNINLDVMLNTTPTEGNLVYEYNPLRNYRLDKDMYEYESHLYTLDELYSRFNISLSSDKQSWYIDGELLTINTPTLIEAGSLVDFESDQLNFDINHPVDIIPQYSYDGSVNLILNDDKNMPRLINSRFTCVGKNQYKIIDRKGNNDTNIYDQGGQFDIDTSLYKRVVEIPKLEFLGVSMGGNFKIGSYTFYFKYSDADGNETDFVAESGIVSMFIGTDLHSINSGIRDENAHKSVRFLLSNIDSGYSYVTVYYTRNTSDVDGNSVTTAHKIDKQYEVNKSLVCNLHLTGEENVIDISVSDINLQYNVASSVRAHTSCQNMLFMGNVHKADINYVELSDISLRFTPTVTTKAYSKPGHEYSESVYNTYADPNFIYNFTGYANGEIYRFGVVYILSDNTLSPVFNIRGRDALGTSNGQYTSIPVYKSDGTRVYVSNDESTGVIIKTEDYTPTSSDSVENVWGVCKLKIDASDVENVYGIRMTADHSQDVISHLKSLGIKGLFFVRQKRLPIRLCQAITIGLDKYSKTPVLPVSPTMINSYKGGHFDTNKPCYIAERFLNDSRELTEDFIDRLYPISSENTLVRAALCPDFDVNPSYYNQIFNGAKYYVSEANFQPINKWLSKADSNDRHFFTETMYKKASDTLWNTQVVTLPDSVPIVAVSDQSFRGVAGSAEEGYKFQYLGRKNKVDAASNIVRGAYGPYLGLVGFSNPFTIININVPDVNNTSIYTQFEARHADKSSYYAISDRFAIEDLTDTIDIVVYRGDSYICTFTHRFNRNFQDPSAPINDEIVDKNTWVDNYSVDNQEKLEKINRGDVNAVPLGMWVTFSLVSNINLNIRTLDSSYPTEEGLTGHKRGFYPYYAMDLDGSFKIPEALLINGGFTKTLGERWNFNVPDVPYIKNEFETRIMYSDIYINDAFKNGFRVFQLTHYRDYPRTYGAISKLVELFGNILCIFEHGVALIPVNERAVAGEGSGGNVFINTSNVLPENPKMLSDTYGTQWPESIVQTPYFVYGVDTVGKKIWRTNGDQFEIISDFKIQEFLNENITLSERELTPVIGVRNVKGHYNAFKQDVMFTFYDNLYGFEEKAWNICYNEVMQKFVTFYSWMPSYSANIDNIHFSFNRDTSKWISKLGTTSSVSNSADGVVLDNVVFTEDNMSANIVGLVNRPLPNKEGTGLPEVKIKYTLERDNFGNYNKFSLNDEVLSFTGTYKELTSKAVWQLNIRADVTIRDYEGIDTSIKQYVSGWKEFTETNAGYYQSVVAITSDAVVNNPLLTEDDKKLPNLSTDFWKHGQSGIIDIKDKIKPCFWYGKQHPFEYEFVVVDNPAVHKIFNNLQIISNKAAPDSFHYEVVGECYEFHEDKKNMYIRQEATKDFYQYNGSDILYNRNFLDLRGKQRDILRDWKPTGKKVKSTMFPLYYARVDTFNEIEDYYKGKTAPNKDYTNLSGSEIVYNEKLNEFRVWTHVKAADIKDPRIGRLRGNMNYQEDVWNVQINPIIFVQRNEPAWNTAELTKETVDKVPISVGNSPIPDDLKGFDISSTTPVEDYMPQDLRDLGYGLEDIDTSNWWDGRKETRLRDKYIKIRVRYTGEELAIITALKTLFTISYA